MARRIPNVAEHRREIRRIQMLEHPDIYGEMVALDPQWALPPPRMRLSPFAPAQRRQQTMFLPLEFPVPPPSPPLPPLYGPENRPRRPKRKRKSTKNTKTKTKTKKRVKKKTKKTKKKKAKKCQTRLRRARRLLNERILLAAEGHHVSNPAFLERLHHILY